MKQLISNEYKTDPTLFLKYEFYLNAFFKSIAVTHAL
jgi:hypothetical protein